MKVCGPRIDALGRVTSRPLDRFHSLPCNPKRQSSVRVSAIAAPEKDVSQYQRPDANGRYGKFGGKYVPETLIPALEKLEIDYYEAVADASFMVGN